MEQRTAIDSLRFVRHQLQNPDLLNLLLDELIAALHTLPLSALTQYNEHRNIAAIHALHTPIDDLLSGVERSVYTILKLPFPIHQRSSTAHTHDLVDDVFRVTKEGSP